MVGWIILGVIVLIIVGINLIRVGVDMAYEGGAFTLSAKVAGVLLQLFPKEEKDEKPKKEKKPKKKRKKKEKPEKPKEETGEKKKGLPLGLSKEELFELVKGVLQKLGRFPRKFRVDRFKLHVLVAGRDPYNTAMGYAYLNEALSILLPMARNTFKVKESDVRTEVDFAADDLGLEFALAMTIRVGQIVGLVLAIAFVGGRVVLKSKLRQKKEARAAKKAAGNIKENTESTELTINTQTEIQAEERMDSNG